MPPPILAFGFASPWLLWGLLAAGVPVIIHLLNRRKFRETQWAAMKFLLEAVRKNARRLQIEQLILLALRMLVLLLFALALARPFVEQMGSYFLADQPAHKILVIDPSFSMGVQSQDATLFDRAKESAHGIVDGATQGDAFNLVQISELPRASISNPAFKVADVKTVIDELQLSHGRGNLRDCLRRVSDFLKLSATPPQKEIYFLSDFQRATWSGDTAADSDEIRRLLADLDRQAALILVDVGQPTDNLAVTEFTPLTPFLAVGEPARFRATVRNFGSTRAEGLSLSLAVGGRQLERKRISLNPGAEVSEIFTHAFAGGGEYPVSLQLQPDALPVDDKRWLAVPVRDRLRVLCVNGRSAGRALGKATDFLAIALAPGPAGSSSRGLFDPVIINAGELQTQDLNRFDCVILCDVAVVTPQEARLFESFLQGGGGLIWCLGDRVQVDGYNQVLYRNGEGPLPAKLGDRQGNAVRREQAFEFDPGDFRHAIVNPFEGNPDAGLETTRTYAYVQAAPNTAKGARVALRFDTGDPAIVELPYGAGRSLLVTTSVDDTWGNWALWPSFLPMVREMVIHASSGRATQRQQLVGTPLVQSYPGGVLSSDVTVTRPDQETVSVSLSEGSGLRQFSYEATDLSGVYDVKLPPPLSRTELFAVNVDPRESDLTRLEPDELKAGLFAGLEYDYYTQWQGRAAATSQRAPTIERGGVSRMLLYAALFLLFVESLMAWHFRLGAALLSAGLLLAWLSTIVPWAWKIHPALALSSLGLPLLLAAVVALRWWRPWAR